MKSAQPTPSLLLPSWSRSGALRRTTARSSHLNPGVLLGTFAHGDGVVRGRDADRRTSPSGFDPDACELTITVGSQVVRPAWGSQAFDDYYDIGGPTSFGSPGRGPSEDETLRYDKRAYFATDGRVSGWVITSERAETPEGVGVGDGRDLVERRYPRADCTREMRARSTPRFRCARSPSAAGACSPLVAIRSRASGSWPRQTKAGDDAADQPGPRPGSSD